LPSCSLPAGWHWLDYPGNWRARWSHYTRRLADQLAGYEHYAEFHQCDLHRIQALRTLRLLMHLAALIPGR
jgi:hypothetical protein